MKKKTHTLYHLRVVKISVLAGKCGCSRGLMRKARGVYRMTRGLDSGESENPVTILIFYRLI